jgi:biopolymer transport protein ExbD
MMKQLVPLVTLAIALSLTSCSHREPDVPSAWENIDLPVAVHFVNMGNPGPGALSFTIDKTGALSQSGVTLTESNLVDIAQARYQRYGHSSTIIFSDADATFESVWSPVQRLREIGLWRFDFAATKKQDEDMHTIGIASIAAPVEEHDTHHRGPVILKTEGEEKGIILIVRLSSSDLKLNNRVVSLEQLDQHFREHAIPLKMATIVLLPSPETHYSQIISVLDACSKHGLNNTCIMEDLDAQPTDPPYPHIEPMEGFTL